MKRTFAGRTILVTRPVDQAAPLVRELERRGARVLLAPTIRLVPARSAALTAALKELAAARFDWITLTSAATVDVFRERLPSPRDVRAEVAVIGEGTAAAFRRWARRSPDLQPATFTTAALARAFPRGSGRVLCARADIAPEGLEDALARKGWEPVRVDAYRTIFASSLPRKARDALRGREVDAVTFTSASTVRGFVGARGDGVIRGPSGGPPKMVCIGPVTAAAARAAGLRPAAVAKPHTIEGLVAALERALPR
ncbi:MAG TPA: uroporphyrinogen-III synthase [Actinomycetota bacterium]|nr:uroporphyrinogen-III synthase [Actinomycetota bacterium]